MTQDQKEVMPEESALRAGLNQLQGELNRLKRVTADLRTDVELMRSELRQMTRDVTIAMNQLTEAMQIFARQRIEETIQKLRQ
jgi:predicted  nucleic acid-binding Zn-ribbon protein